MKTRFALLFALALSILLAACNSSILPTPTLHGDPLAPTAVLADPDVLAPTPEIFNPLDPSPTPSGSTLPLTCQVTDLNVQIEPAAGYCFAYPTRFTTGLQTLINANAVLGPAIPSGGDTIQATFSVQVTSYDPNQSLDQQVDNFLREFTVVAPETLTRALLNVGGEEAVMVDNIPVFMSWRIVFVPHNGQLYRLMYWPVDIADAKADMDDLYQTTLGSFAFTSGPDIVVTSDEASTPQPPVLAGLTTSYGVINLVIPPE